METKTKEEMQQALEQQLHEQYAINNNEGIKSFVAFIAAIIALFGAFGYVFVNTEPQCAPQGCAFFGGSAFYMEAYIGIAIITSIVLGFLADIALALGWNQRQNHWIIQHIREKYYDEEPMRDVFGSIYKASKKNFWSFIPGIFNSLYWLFVVLQAVVIGATRFQLCRVSECCCRWSFFILIAILIISLGRRCYYYHCKYKKLQ